jgi:hypothetical protein
MLSYTFYNRSHYEKTIVEIILAYDSYWDYLPEPGKSEILSQPQEKGSSKCPHRFGYLAKRLKDEPIPDECLSCSKLLKCLHIENSVSIPVVEERRFCRYCGTESKNDAPFCEKCGKKLD